MLKQSISKIEGIVVRYRGNGDSRSRSASIATKCSFYKASMKEDSRFPYVPGPRWFNFGINTLYLDELDFSFGVVLQRLCKKDFKEDQKPSILQQKYVS